MTFDSWQAPDHLYFITASVCGWKPIFVNPNYSKIVLGSLEWLRKERRMKLYAFVLMPSHFHAIVFPVEKSIDQLLREFGSFTAHAIVRQLENDNQIDLINFFHEERQDKRTNHRIWQDIQAKNIFTRKFLIQKLEYIHQNPVSKEWNLVTDRSDYQYSSACFYDCDKMPVIEIDDIRELM